MTPSPGEDHAGGDAEAHFARREVRHIDHHFADEVFRLVVGLDAGEDVAFAEFADIKLETQQFVRAVDVAAFEDAGDAQVGFGEVVDGDPVAGFSGGFVFANRRFFFEVFFAVGDDGVGLCGFHPLHHRAARLG